MPQDRWPFPPSILDVEFFGSSSTASTTGAVLWGGGTTKPLGFGPGLIVVVAQLAWSHDQEDAYASWQLQKSVDGTAWTDADPGGAKPWYARRTNANNQMHNDTLLLTYAKTTSAQEYARVQWKTSAGTLTLQEETADGRASGFRMFKFPTWVA